MNTAISLQNVLMCLAVTLNIFNFSNGEAVRNHGMEIYHSHNLEDKRSRAVGDLYEHDQNEKRGILLGLSIGLSLTNIGVDVFFGNGGCCMVFASTYKNACGKVQRIKKIRDSITATSKLIAKKELESEHTYNWISSIDNNNARINDEIERIKDLVVDIVDAMDPNAKNMYASKAHNITQLAKKSPAVVAKWSNIELDIQYQALYKTTLGRIELLAGLVPDLGEISYKKLMKEYQIRKINKNLDPKVRKVMAINAEIRAKAGGQAGGKGKSLFKSSRIGDDVFLKKMVAKSILNKNNMKAAKTTRTKITSALGKGFRFIGIGFEAAAIGLKIKQCADVMKQVAQKEKDIEADEVDVDTILMTIDSNLVDLNNGYKEVIKPLSTPTFISLIKDFQSLIAESSLSETPAAKVAISDLDVFIKSINLADPVITDTLQKKLIKSLQFIKFKYLCLEKKYAMVRSISNNCKRGINTLDNLYKQAATQEKLVEKCKNDAKIVYTTFEQVRDAIVQKESVEQKYNPKCMLNNKIIMDSLCEKSKCEGYSESSVATSQITADDIKMVCATYKCRPQPLTDREKLNICMFKTILTKPVTVESILPFLPPNKDPIEVGQVLANCA